MHASDHWEQVYQNKAFNALSWYAPHLDRSLSLIEQLCPDRASALIDIGSGQSTLVDDLLDRGYANLSVLDLSATAIEGIRQRLGQRAGSVRFHVGDITKYPFEGQRLDLWHDRAVFHFLTDPLARQAYIAQLRRSLKPAGHLILATFGPQGPERCSGLSVVRYSAEALHRQIGPDFELLGTALEQHHTPMGTHQQFLYAWFQRH